MNMLVGGLSNRPQDVKTVSATVFGLAHDVSVTKTTQISEPNCDLYLSLKLVSARRKDSFLSGNTVLYES